MRELTHGFMRVHGIPKEQRTVFRRSTGGAVIPTPEWGIAGAMLYDWEMFAVKLLTPEAWGVYNRRMVLALQAHDIATSEAIKKYFAMYAPVPDSMRTLMQAANTAVEHDRALAFVVAWNSPSNDKLPCPVCAELLPKAVPSMLKIGQTCKNHTAQRYTRR